MNTLSNNSNQIVLFPFFFPFSSPWLSSLFPYFNILFSRLMNIYMIFQIWFSSMFLYKLPLNFYIQKKKAAPIKLFLPKKKEKKKKLLLNFLLLIFFNWKAQLDALFFGYHLTGLALLTQTRLSHKFWTYSFKTAESLNLNIYIYIYYKNKKKKKT